MSALLVFGFNLNDLFITVLGFSDFQSVLGDVTVFFVFYFMASGFSRRIDSGRFIGAVFMAVIKFAVGAWLPLVAVIVWMEIKQIESPGLEYYICAVASTVLSPVVLLYCPIKDIVNIIKEIND